MGRWLAVLALCCALTVFGRSMAAAEVAPVRVGLTPVFLDDQTAFVNAWRAYLEARLMRPVVFVQRARYREIIDLLRASKLDFAWVCGYPYVHHREVMDLLAVPVYQGKPSYRSYLHRARSGPHDALHRRSEGQNLRLLRPGFQFGLPVAGLRSGRAEARRRGSFFARTFFTGSHRAVVQAVADGLAQGGAVDGYVWDILAAQHPELTAETRIVAKSREFGFPPFVAAKTVAPDDVEAMRRTLIAMGDDAEGRKLLRRLHLDGFVAGEDRMFDAIAAMMPAAQEK